MAKTVLITGCSSGIGASLVHSFQKRGLTVYATARKLSSLSSFSDIPNVHLLTLDVTSDASVHEAYEQVKLTTGGKLDYLINNAGLGLTLPTLDTPIEDAKALFETNFWGPYRMMQVFSPLVIEAKGTIVNVGSGLGDISMPYTSMYNSSKAALYRLGDTLRIELAPFGVKVVTVKAGGVLTQFSNKPMAGGAVLPPDSRYLPVEEQIGKMARMENNIKRMNCDKFAEQVTGDILGGSKGVIWRGGDATFARIAITFFPQWIVDFILLKDSGLSKMKPLPSPVK